MEIHQLLSKDTISLSLIRAENGKACFLDFDDENFENYIYDEY